MSKITFRAEEELIEQIEGVDASKSTVMREALRWYLSDLQPNTDEATLLTDELDSGPVVDALVEHVDRAVHERLASRAEPRLGVTLDISVDDGESTEYRLEPRTDSQAAAGSRPRDDDPEPCVQCGETPAEEDVYCSNCGERIQRTSICECDEELSSDWAFCPSCGRRTPAADVLGRS